MRYTGKTLKNLRERAGWSQSKLAKYCGVSSTYVSLLENNKATLTEKARETLKHSIDRLTLIVGLKGKSNILDMSIKQVNYAGLAFIGLVVLFVIILFIIIL